MIAWHTEDRHDADLGRVLDQVLPSHPHVREVTRAVEAVLQGEAGIPVLASDRALWTAARALASVGDRSAADTVLSATCSLSEWSGVLDVSGLPEPTIRLIESGLVQATASSVLGGGLLVRLDLRKLPSEETGLELMYVALIHRLVDACLPLWHSVQGRGTLLVHGLPLHAGSLGRGGRTGVRAVVGLQAIFRQRLDQGARREGWSQAPALVQAS
jgi:hypothetical protein